MNSTDPRRGRGPPVAARALRRRARRAARSATAGPASSDLWIASAALRDGRLGARPRAGRPRRPGAPGPRAHVLGDRSCRTRSCHSRIRTKLRYSARQRRRNAEEESSRCCSSRWFQRFSSPIRSLVGSAKRECSRSACSPLLLRPLPRVLHRQPGDDRDHVAGDAVPLRLEQHPAEARVDGQAGEVAARPGQRRRLAARGPRGSRRAPAAGRGPPSRRGSRAA